MSRHLAVIIVFFGFLLVMAPEPTGAQQPQPRNPVKRGVGVASQLPYDNDATRLGVDWFYDWGCFQHSEPNYYPFASDLGWCSDYCTINYDGWLMTFNEPERPEQNITAVQAAAHFNNLYPRCSGAKFVSPAVIWNQPGIAWMDEFISLVDMTRFDACAFHVYGNVDRLERIENHRQWAIANGLNCKRMLTEWAWCGDGSVAEFAAMVAAIEATDLYAHAYYVNRGVWNDCHPLFDSDGTMTAYGVAYSRPIPTAVTKHSVEIRPNSPPFWLVASVMVLAAATWLVWVKDGER